MRVFPEKEPEPKLSKWRWIRLFSFRFRGGPKAFPKITGLSQWGEVGPEDTEHEDR